MKTVFTAERLVTPIEWVEAPIVVVEDGHLTTVGSRESVEVPHGVRRLDFPGLILAPGFIDIHIHGGSGHDVMETQASALCAIESHMAKHGVTSYLPTTVTAPEDRILKALGFLGRAATLGRELLGAVPLGVHLEGPFISHAKRGVHPPEYLLPPSPHKIDLFWQASEGAVRMMTVAPEIPGAIETISHARRLGIHCSLGHSNADYAQATRAIAAGAVHATHTFNAMRSLDHRDPGILGAVLTSDEVSADIIADGVHVDPSVIQLFLRAKGQERAVLITDAISASGMPEGRYQLGPLEVEVRDGRCEYQGKLAGSVLTLDRAVRNVMAFAGWTLQQAIRLATFNPAQVLGLTGDRGYLAPGRVADMVALTPEAEVAHTIIAGRLME